MMRLRAMALSLAVACPIAVLPALPARAQVTDHEYPLNGATQLRLNVSGNVHIMPAAAAQSVSIHVVDYGPPIPQMRFTDSRSGKRLTISISGPSQSILPLNGATGYELQVVYPAALALDLREFSGHVQADNLVGAAELYDADGSIAISGAQGAVTAEADAGAIDLKDAHASIELTTGNGPVTAALAPGWHGTLVRIESSNGALSLTVPPGFRGRYDVTSASGPVHNALRTINGAPLVFMLTQNGPVSIATSPAP